ncbi:MAG: hypothetical protein AAGG72_08635 [Pseudomonadota bacterium]
MKLAITVTVVLAGILAILPANPNERDALVTAMRNRTQWVATTCQRNRDACHDVAASWRAAGDSARTALSSTAALVRLTFKPSPQPSSPPATTDTWDTNSTSHVRNHDDGPVTQDRPTNATLPTYPRIGTLRAADTHPVRSAPSW